jgi:ribonuclease BN (tRNA processing enzyme)
LKILKNRGERLRIRVLGPYGGSAPNRRMTTFLINDRTALDAGALTSTLSLPAQRRIDCVVVTHAHFDHVATLPFFFENIFGRRGSIEIVAPEAVLKPLRDHLFNDALWPDFTRLPSRRRATVRLRAIPENETFFAAGLAFRPVGVTHIVPTFGYLVSTPSASVLFSGDTAPTRKLWRLADSAENLKAIFLEVSFSDAQERIARASKHLIPRHLPAELAKTRQEVPVYLYHMKPPSEAAIRREVKALRMPRLKFLKEGQVLDF